MTDFKPGDRVLSILGDRRSGHVVGPAPSSSVRVRFDGQTDTENYHWSNLERIDPMDDSPEPSPHGAAREIIREEILYRLKGAESHARACASDHGETYLASQADKAADVLTARLAIFTDVLEPAGRPSRADVAAAIWNAEGLDRAVLTDCWEIAGRVLDLYPEAEDLLGPCPSEGAEPAQDLPVIAYGDIPEGATYEMRQRWVKKGVMSEPVLGDARYHLVSAPEPEPDAELVGRATSASPPDHCT